MPRKPTATEEAAAVAMPPVPEPDVTEFPDAPAEPAPATATDKPTRQTKAQPASPYVSVRVRDDCPWATVQAAGAPWGRVALPVSPDDPRLPELRRSPYLEVTP